MFQESDLENLIVNLISTKGFEYVFGENLNRNYENVLIDEDIKAFLLKNMRIKILLMRK